MEDASRVVEAEMPDMLFLQEISQQQLNQLIHHLELSPNNRLKNVSFDSSKMLALLSRFPLVNLTPSGTSRIQIQKLRVKIDGGIITVFNVHFIRGYRQKRNAAINSFIREQLAGAQSPIILAGDFNTTSQTSIYRAFKAILNNSHDQAGWGFGFTYPSASAGGFGLHLPAMVRIDHIFTSPHFKTTFSNVLPDDGGSDHYPVVAKLLLLSP